jgi:hypothetical protein
MKVDTQPFPSVNMVEGYDRSASRQLDFALGLNMAGFASRRQTKNEEADPYDRPQKEEKGYITEKQVRHVRNSGQLLLISSINMNTSTNSVSGVSQRKRSISTVLESV